MSIGMADRYNMRRTREAVHNQMIILYLVHPTYLLCEGIAIAHCRPDREAQEASNGQTAHQTEARNSSRDVHVFSTALQSRVVRQRRGRYHAHAGHVAVRQAEQQDYEHEENVGVDERSA